MKRRRTTFFGVLTLLAGLMLPWATRAQNELLVADGTYTNSYVPIYGFWADAAQHNQVIYTEDMIGDLANSNITKLTFYMSSTSSGWNTTVTVSLGQTSQSTLSGLSTDDVTQVWQGIVNGSTAEIEIEFDEPFLFEGGNLLLDITTTAASYSSGSFYGVSASGSTAVYSYNGSSYSQTFVPKTLFEYIPVSGDLCARPRGMHIDTTDAYGATISWNAGEASQWIVYLDGEEMALVSDTTYTFTGLTPNTDYQASARVLCGAGDTSNYANKVFHTECITLTQADDLPLYENFESYTAGGDIDHCWNRINLYNSSSMYPRVYSENAHSGDNCLNFYLGSGTPLQNNYAVLPRFDNLNGLMLSFYSMAGYPDIIQIEVGTMTDPDDETTFSSIYTTPTDQASNEWELHEVLIPENTTANYVALRSTGTAAYYNAYVDDVTLLIAPECMRPGGVTVSNINVSDEGVASATVIVEDSNEVNHYSATLKLNNETVATYEFTEAELQLNDLLSSTRYTVEVNAICGDGNPTSVVTTTFKTPCISLTTLPYTCDFETVDESLPICWERINESYPYVINNADNAHNSAKFLYIYGDYSYGIMPPIDTEVIDLSNTMLSFWTKIGTSSGVDLEIGIMSDPADENTFTLLNTVTCTTSTAHELYEVPLDNYEPSMGNYIVFHGVTTNNLYLDDVTLMAMPSCTRPTVTVTNVTNSSAVVNITDANNVNHYILTLPGNTTIELNGENSYVMDGLSATTAYTVSAVTVCEDQTSTAATTVNFSTICESEDFPWACPPSELYTIGNGDWTPCWSYLDFYRSTTGDTMLYVYSSVKGSQFVLPAVNIDFSNAQLRTNVSTTSNGSFFRVGVQDGTVTTWLDTIALNAVSNFTDATEYTVPLNSYTGNGKRVVVGNINTNYVYHFDFYIEPIDACPAVGNLAVSDVTNTGAHVSWATRGNESQWAIYLNDEYLTTVSEMEYDLEDLTDNTPYSVGVRAICGAGDTSTMRSRNFRTTCVLLTHDDMPYIETFDNYDYNDDFIPCWNRIDLTTSTSSYPYVSNSYSHISGGNSLYFYNYGGINYAIMPPVDDLNGLAVNFFTYYTYSSSYAYLQMGTMSDPTNQATFNLLYSANTNITTDTWIEHEVYIPEETTDKYIAFRIQGSNYYNCYLDDISLSVSTSCRRPQDVTFVNTTDNSTTIIITDTNNTANYSVVVSDESTSTTYEIQDTVLVLEDLTPNTLYTVSVSSVCEDGAITNAVTNRTRTACVMLSQDDLPLTEDFNNYTSWGDIDACWNRINLYTGSGSTIYPAVYSSVNNSGSGNSMYFYIGSDTTQINYLVMPPIDDLNGLSVLFYTYNEYSSSYIQMGTMSDPNNQSTFTPIYSTPNAPTYTWMDHEVDIPDGTTDKYIAFRVKGSAYYNIYLDDITVYHSTSCKRPQSLTFVDITETSATLTINDTNNVNNYLITVSNGASSTTYNTESNTFDLTSLSPSQLYNVTVVSICAAGDTTIPVKNSFRTVCGATVAPFTEDFESYASSWNDTEIDCWNKIGNGYITIESGSGSRYVRFYPNATTETTYLALPQFATEISQLQMSLQYHPESTSNSGTFTIGYFTSLDDESSYVEVLSIDASECSSSSYFDSVTATFEDAPAGSHIAFGYQPQSSFTNWYWYVDNVTVTYAGDAPAPSTCAAPTNVHSTAVTTNSITIDWTSSASSWKVSVNGGADQVATAHPYTIDGLAAGTDYSIRVKSVCSDGSESVYSSALNVTTEEEQENPGDNPGDEPGDNPGDEPGDNPGDEPGDNPGDDPNGIDGVDGSLFAIYPNPASTTVSVSIDGTGLVMLIDMNGRMVGQWTAEGDILNIDLSSMSKGAYFVRVTTDNGTSVRKLIVR